MRASPPTATPTQAIVAERQAPISCKATSYLLYSRVARLFTAELRSLCRTALSRFWSDPPATHHLLDRRAKVGSIASLYVSYDACLIDEHIHRKELQSVCFEHLRLFVISI